METPAATTVDIVNATGTLSLESAGWEGGRILSGTGNDKLIYRITDHLGSVRVVKDGDNVVRQRFDYYPFGSESRVWTVGTNTPPVRLPLPIRQKGYVLLPLEDVSTIMAHKGIF